jgi:alpha-galactosidase/6-phospho-beta-glucosidase family protein
MNLETIRDPAKHLHPRTKTDHFYGQEAQCLFCKFNEADVFCLITSIYSNKKDIQTVNVRNNGMISCLPDDVSIEVNSVIDADGAHPLQITTPIQP